MKFIIMVVMTSCAPNFAFGNPGIPAHTPPTTTAAIIASIITTSAGQPGSTSPTQAVAKAYGAVCTPDFFGYNAKLTLQYRGRLDDSGRSSKPDAPRELFDAMVQVARTGQGPAKQTLSIGCSIKWKR